MRVREGRVSKGRMSVKGLEKGECEGRDRMGG